MSRRLLSLSTGLLINVSLDPAELRQGLCQIKVMLGVSQPVIITSCPVELPGFDAREQHRQLRLVRWTLHGPAADDVFALLKTSPNLVSSVFHSAASISSGYFVRKVLNLLKLFVSSVVHQ